MWFSTGKRITWATAGALSSAQAAKRFAQSWTAITGESYTWSCGSANSTDALLAVVIDSDWTGHIGYDSDVLQSWVLWTVVGYLCGSIPFGLLIGWVLGVDIRGFGSGNVGATNAGRVLGRKWGVVCLALDVLKGVAPVAVAGWSQGYTGCPLSARQAWQWLAVAAAAMLGHMYPVWLRFRGGKGVATGLGAMLGFWPLMTIPVIASAVVWLLVLGVSRYISMASMTAAVTIPLFLIAHGAFGQRQLGDVAPFWVSTAVLAMLVIVRHRSNIARLWAGTEPRIGSSVAQPCRMRTPRQ